MGREGSVDTRPCRLCGYSAAEKVRESIARRGARQYAMRWYLCPDCRDLSFAYRVSSRSEPGSEAVDVSGVDEPITSAETAIP
jgi:hypothetical protein